MSRFMHHSYGRGTRVLVASMVVGASMALLAASVRALQDSIAAADGLILSTPEYNNSMPGVLKNAIDWLSRSATDRPRVFRGKPVAIVGASVGGFGTVLGQNAWLPPLHALGVKPWTEGRLLIPHASKAFDATGRLTDAALAEQLSQFLAGFTHFAAIQPASISISS